jgi:GT2 family glycosyltransferase
MNIHTIAIVLVNYNGFEDTRDCLVSISKVNGEQPYVVIVDNNSKDKDDLKKLSETYNYLHIIYNDSNVGFGKANNLGIDWVVKNLDTDFIFLLNNDTEINKDTLENLILNFPNNQETVLVSPKILTYEKNPRIWYGGGFINYKRISVNVSGIGQVNQDLKSQYVEFASGCAMLFKTEYLRLNSSFDSNFFMYDEDVELCIRILKDNKKIYFINEAVIYHKCQGSQKANAKKEINQLHPDNPNLEFYLSLTIPNRFYIINKHFTSFYKIWRKLTLSCYWAAKAIQYLLFGNSKMAFKTIKLIVRSQIYMRK